ncbi:MAG: hypothetical protein GWM88_14030 [Pseudomonadales bacterium]|nr:hypothetical protein [Pseudomonadales bacterium]NIX09060.1 hypothetical protein [Pseudomonadales bacterium]
MRQTQPMECGIPVADLDRMPDFYCSDPHDTLAAAEAKGAELRSDRSMLDPQRPLRLCFFSEPEGNVIELLEVG